MCVSCFMFPFSIPLAVNLKVKLHIKIYTVSQNFPRLTIIYKANHISIISSTHNSSTISTFQTHNINHININDIPVITTLNLMTKIKPHIKVNVHNQSRSIWSLAEIQSLCPSIWSNTSLRFGPEIQLGDHDLTFIFCNKC